MLSLIQIRDLAIIDHLELDLAPGLTALTGETGAGKSILLDALQLVLGDRADAGIIRFGAERCQVTARFDLDDAPEAGAWLAEQALEADGECVVRRVVQREGRSRAWINGSAVPLQSLRALGERLVEIHGQHQHQALLKRAEQRRLLDAFGGHEGAVERLADLWNRLREARRRLETLEGAGDTADRLELLDYQIDELERFAPGEEEYSRLDEEQRRLANAGRILEGCSALVTELYEGDDALHDRLGRLQAELEVLVDLDPRLEGVTRLMEESMIPLKEAAEQLRDHATTLELDPARLQEVEERITRWHDLARKHAVPPEELPVLLLRLQSEREGLLAGREELETLRAACQTLEQEALAEAQALSGSRREAAARLGEAVTGVLRELGMGGAHLEVAVETADPPRLAAHGIDEVSFRVATNPGQPPAPLERIASGGELSRIGLAIQALLAEANCVPTLIYDEVDAGIGGATAAIVGARLREVAQRRQVLCVTHLAQVAAHAHQQIRVTKEEHPGEDVTTTLEVLESRAREEEIARMLSGKTSREALAHARELLAGVGDEPRRRA